MENEDSDLAFGLSLTVYPNLHPREYRGEQAVSAHCCCSVTKPCLTLCNSMDCSTPGFPDPHHLPEFAQVHVHWWCHPTISSSITLFFFCLQSFPGSVSFLMSRLFASGGQTTGASASASVNIQHWFPLGWAGLISLQSKRLSRIFFSILMPWKCCIAFLKKLQVSNFSSHWKWNISVDWLSACKLQVLIWEVRWIEV